MSIYYRPNVQNGSVAKRPRSKPSPRPSPRLMHANQPLEVSAPHQSRALLYLIAFGACIAAGFVFSLNQHFIASALGREGVRLRAELDQAGSERRHLELNRARASSPLEIEHAANRQGNLAPLKMDSPAVLRVTPAMVKRESLSRADAEPASEKSTKSEPR